ncbi:hypothetical protein EDB19DRAFT_1916954 [Suillus lakei]|nr:hypothetical protein EDB19DRAFT_1916954 [Suillus lakei]
MVLLWAGSQSSFWTIEAADLLCAMQAIFNTMYPGVKYNIQPRGPIMGVITQRLCTWRSNFGSTAIALIANFLTSLRERKDEDDEEDEDKNENTDSKEKFMTQMAASLLEGYAFLFTDPDTCKASEIYHSVFILQMIAMMHLNAVAGFIDVPELDTSALSSTKMEAVIGACTVALECALKLVAEKEKKSTDLKTPLKINKSTGKESSTPLAFSELNWGQYMTDYHLSIVKHGPKYTMDTIAMARQFVKDLASDASTKGSLADNSVASSRGEFKAGFQGRFGCDLDVDLDVDLDTQKHRNLISTLTSLDFDLISTDLTPTVFALPRRSLNYHSTMAAESVLEMYIAALLAESHILVDPMSSSSSGSSNSSSDNSSGESDSDLPTTIPSGAIGTPEKSAVTFFRGV